jgi:hypothetical protein
MDENGGAGEGLRQSAPREPIGHIVSRSSIEIDETSSGRSVARAFGAVLPISAEADRDAWPAGAPREGAGMNHRKPDATRLDSDVQAHIGRQLRAGYVDILNQPVPDRFLELLAELDQKQEEFGATEEDLRQNGSR